MKNNINWNFDNTYFKLPESFREIIKPVKVKNPSLILLNKSLATELIKNMGPYPRVLENRTGRFADSVELLNLRETAAGVSGSYTYQLSPYETFENTGDRVWPAGYNPKPLIAKSIREIYYEYKQEQLVQLRRT